MSGLSCAHSRTPIGYKLSCLCCSTLVRNSASVICEVCAASDREIFFCSTSVAKTLIVALASLSLRISSIILHIVACPSSVSLKNFDFLFSTSENISFGSFTRKSFIKRPIGSFPSYAPFTYIICSPSSKGSPSSWIIRSI